ncbi:MAG: hypothetical protein V7609_370 [Verrucomicrobiota bacterium]
MNIQEQITLIDELDLEPIKVKLTHPKEGPGWTLQHADLAEKVYKRFLTLNLKYPDRPHVPSHDMDIFWHYHILDTMKYAEDCDLIFGRFLHHFPYLGLRGEQDAARLQHDWENMKALYEAEFGDKIAATAQTSGDDGPEVCGPDPDSCTPTPSCEEAFPSQNRLRPRPFRVLAAQVT